MNRIVELIKTEKMRYLIVGGLTTLVNLVVFHFFVSFLKWDVTVGNVISIVVAILFAFFANKFIVFQSKNTAVGSFFVELVKFVSGRMITMAVEVGGVYLLHSVIGIAAMPSKIITQVIVIILNYFISKYFVFRKN